MGNSCRVWPPLCMVFKGGKPRFFPMKVSLIVVSQQTSSRVRRKSQAKRATKREAIFKDAKLTRVSSKGVSYYFFKCCVLILNVRG